MRKIRVMGYMPEADLNMVKPISMSQEEYETFVNNTVELVLSKFREKKLVKWED